MNQYEWLLLTYLVNYEREKMAFHVILLLINTKILTAKNHVWKWNQVWNETIYLDDMYVLILFSDEKKIQSC